MIHNSFLIDQWTRSKIFYNFC